MVGIGYPKRWAIKERRGVARSRRVGRRVALYSRSLETGGPQQRVVVRLMHGKGRASATVTEGAVARGRVGGAACRQWTVDSRQ